MDSQLFDMDTVQEGAFTWPTGTWLEKRMAQVRVISCKVCHALLYISPYQSGVAAWQWCSKECKEVSDATDKR